MTSQTLDLEDIRGTGDLQAVIDTAQEAATADLLEEGQSYAQIIPAGARLERFTTDERLLAPRRKTGTVTLFDATSFAAYVLKHHEDDRTELYADPTKPGVVAVLNGHGSRPDADVDPDTGWGDHRAVLTFRETVAWKRWVARNGVLGTQSDFAEHIEESLPEIIEPAAADMLELAQSFQANTRVAFESAKDLGSGQRALVYRESVEATAGTKGEITIPKEFVIGVAPYEGSAPYRVTARLRYRLSNGSLSIGYVLDRPEDVLRNAFDDVLVQVQQQTERTALLGVAPAAGQ
jgi:uncharacterized protein YfdQ (DUF2303 family)